jgi:glutamate/tyrosine decarboxylase-like PLP-dependent enzyme
MTAADSVRESAVFRDEMKRLRELYFSRNPELWPVFRDPGFARVRAFRFQHLHPGQRVAKYPEGRDLYAALRAENSIPEDGLDPTQTHARLLFAAATAKAWEDPAAVENVVSMPSDPALYGSMLGLLANPNLVYREYSEMADELEKTVVRQIANLVGYDPAQADGVFTQGGTFCNMYGYLFGIRKSMPDSLRLGLEYGQDYRIINSQGGHYSNTTNLSVLGVNMARKTIRIQLTKSNDIDIIDLERQLTACFQLKCVVPAIMLTMGTTDTFGVDRVKPVYELCQRLCARFEIHVPPHIHVDAAVGWPLIFFLDYDFEKNPLQINAVTLEGLARNVDRFRELRFADSFTIDFQKWGFVPYTSSLVMTKDRSSFKALAHDPEMFSYFERDTQGQTHLQSTIECSRGAAGLYGAYAAMQYLGKRGYQMLIAHGLQNANYFRHCLWAQGAVKVIAPENQGPSVGFRLYNRDHVEDGEQEFAYEQKLRHDPEYLHRVQRNTSFHRSTFLARGKQDLYTNWVQFAAHTEYDDAGRWEALPGEKAVFMNPLTEQTHIEAFMHKLRM